jgi:hypothetical protein
MNFTFNNTDTFVNIRRQGGDQTVWIMTFEKTGFGSLGAAVESV